MSHRRVDEFLVNLGALIVRVVGIFLSIGAVIAFGGVGILCVYAGLILLKGPVTRDGETWYGDTSDRFSGPAAIVMGSIALYAAFTCVREWVNWSRGGAFGAEPDAIINRGDPAGPSDAGADSHGTDRDPSVAYLEDRQCTKGRVP